MEHTPILPPAAPLEAYGPLLPSAMGIEPLSAVVRALAGFNRDQLGSTIELLIDLLNVTDFDPDLEADDRGGETIAVTDDPDVAPHEDDGDPDLEQTMDEDDWYPHAANGPGCPIADAGGAGQGEDDEQDGTGDGDVSWPEWQSLPAATRRSGAITGRSTDIWGRTVHEDAEDDDPAGQYDEDCITGPVPRGLSPGCTISDPDYGGEELGERDEGDTGLTPDYGIDQTKSLPDLMVLTSDQVVMAPHRRRIRLERCVPRYERYRDWRSGDVVRKIRGYNLIDEPVAPSRRSLLHRKRGMPRRPRA